MLSGESKFGHSDKAAADWLRNPARQKHPSFIGTLRKRLLAISPEEATFARRGFSQCDCAVRLHLERVGRSFLEGYNLALADEDGEQLSANLNAVASEFQGFAFEGAAMALTVLDVISLWRKERLKKFLTGPGAAHAYMVHVGVGWALARLPWQIKPLLARLDPLLGWLAIDGYGFHEGYFHERRSIGKLIVPRRLNAHQSRVFDQGLGRSLWFINGADASRIASTIAAFPLDRRPDIWSGVGLACAYAGGADAQTIKSLGLAAAPYRLHLAQGAAFAAKARQRAANPTPHTEMACEILCGLSAAEASQVTDQALKNLDHQGPEPSYEVWRRRIRLTFTHLWS